jgi:hypothetical protein
MLHMPNLTSSGNRLRVLTLGAGNCCVTGAVLKPTVGLFYSKRPQQREQSDVILTAASPCGLRYSTGPSSRLRTLQYQYLFSVDWTYSSIKLNSESFVGLLRQQVKYYTLMAAIMLHLTKDFLPHTKLIDRWVSTEFRRTLLVAENCISS